MEIEEITDTFKELIIEDDKNSSDKDQFEKDRDKREQELLDWKLANWKAQGCECEGMWKDGGVKHLIVGYKDFVEFVPHHYNQEKYIQFICDQYSIKHQFRLWSTLDEPEKKILAKVEGYYGSGCCISSPFVETVVRNILLKELHFHFLVRACKDGVLTVKNRVNAPSYIIGFDGYLYVWKFSVSDEPIPHPFELYLIKKYGVNLKI